MVKSELNFNVTNFNTCMNVRGSSIQILLVILFVAAMLLFYRYETLYLLKRQSEEIAAIKNLVRDVKKFKQL